MMPDHRCVNEGTSQVLAGIGGSSSLCLGGEDIQARTLKGKFPLDRRGGHAGRGDGKCRVGEHGAGSCPAAFLLWQDSEHSLPTGSKTHKEPWEPRVMGRVQRLPPEVCGPGMDLGCYWELEGSRRLVLGMEAPVSKRLCLCGLGDQLC